MIDLLSAPLSYAFMQRGALAAMMVGVLCAVLGCYVVLRSLAFLGDAMAHAILPGVAIAYLVRGNLLLGALVAAVIVALGITFVSRQGTIKEDTAIGILFAAALALGVALISSTRSYAVDLTHILFGNVLGVNVADLWLIAGLSLLVLAAVALMYRPFLLVSFDPILAATLRLPVERVRMAMLVLLALTIVVSLQVVGVALVERTAPARARLDSFLMSCRVIGREAEGAFLAALLRRLAAEGVTTVEAEFIPTPKNALASGFLPANGFVAGAQGIWLRDLAAVPPPAADVYPIAVDLSAV